MCGAWRAWRPRRESKGAEYLEEFEEPQELAVFKELEELEEELDDEEVLKLALEDHIRESQSTQNTQNHDSPNAAPLKNEDPTSEAEAPPTLAKADESNIDVKLFRYQRYLSYH